MSAYQHLWPLGTFTNLSPPDFSRIGTGPLVGNLYNPFFIAAKRWGNNFHTLVYTGPKIEKLFSQPSYHFSYDINSNIHYMISGTRNFIGLEINKTIIEDNLLVTFRPQMRVEVNDHLLIGIVTGIPLGRENARISTFLRIIYEPKHK
jgi:hypothetical protein